MKLCITHHGLILMDFVINTSKELKNCQKSLFSNLILNIIFVCVHQATTWKDLKFIIGKKKQNALCVMK